MKTTPSLRAHRMLTSRKVFKEFYFHFGAEIFGKFKIYSYLCK